MQLSRRSMLGFAGLGLLPFFMRRGSVPLLLEGELNYGPFTLGQSRYKLEGSGYNTLLNHSWDYQQNVITATPATHKDRLNLKNFEVAGSKALGGSAHGVEIGNYEVVDIEHVQSQNNAGDGFRIGYSGTGNNEINMLNCRAGQNKVNGASFKNTYGFLVDGGLFSQNGTPNDSADSTGNGLFFWESGEGKIIGVQCDGDGGAQGRNGIALSGCGWITIGSPFINQQRVHGIVLSDCHDITISGAIIRNCFLGEGIRLVNCTGIEVQGCRIFGTAGAGIREYGTSDYNNFVGNDVRGCGAGIITVGTNSRVV